MLDFYYSDSNFKVRYKHEKTDGPYYSDFHLHDRFEIYFVLSGPVNYFIEKNVYPLKYGDLLIMNCDEIHKPSLMHRTTKEGSTGSTYERIVIHFDPTIPKLFNSSSYNLLNCFINRPHGEKNKIILNNEQIDEIISMFKKIELLQKGTSDSHRLLKLTVFIELLVFINRAFLSANDIVSFVTIPKRLLPIIDFIENNLECDLSLKRLEKEFYINAQYLSRLFKTHTGSNIHEYIIYKRLSKAKSLISKGNSCSEACLMSGFNDYSNFSKLFKRTVGLSPQVYKNKINK